MRVVIDTNVLISAILKDRVPEEILLYVCSETNIQWIVTPEILAEYFEVLHRPKFSLPPDIIVSWERVIDANTISFESIAEAPKLSDPGDEKFLACAIAANADILISGDKVLKQVLKIGGTLILSPSQFKEYLLA